jgi:hypothetical protein
MSLLSYRQADLIPAFEDAAFKAYLERFIPMAQNTIELSDPHGSAMDIPRKVEEIILEGMWEKSTEEERKKYLNLRDEDDTLDALLRRL